MERKEIIVLIIINEGIPDFLGTYDDLEKLKDSLNQDMDYRLNESELSQLIEDEYFNKNEAEYRISYTILNE